LRDYVEGVDYVHALQPDLTPAWIDHVLRAKGFASPRQNENAFRHVDLGCGSGLTTLALAAAYPEATCIGVDASPGLMEAATALAACADLPNARFIHARFGGRALKAAMGADYVTANGVYSWVAASTRVQFIETVKALCCPKGVAVVSLNLTPGWLAMAATQRLLNDAGTGDNPLMERLVIARSFLENAAATGRQPELVAGAQKVGTFGDKYGQTYLAHEFLAGGWASGWTADLARDLAPLAFRATTYLDLLCDDFALTKAERAVLETAPTAAAALSYRDLAHGRAHARAVFQPLDAPQAANRLAGWLRLVGPADTLDYAVS
ncbi:MAG: methyltransferase domain-containing protein, partial [Alphaproteobacteria bacterium]